MTAGHASWRQQQRRKDFVFAALGLAVLAALAVMALWVQGLAQDRDALARQVQDLGGTPVAGAPGLRGEPGVSVTGPSGKPGEKGERGESGKPAPTLTPSPGASGASGVPGEPGADSTIPGPTGEPGADSTVPGPQGERGERGDTGERGPAGESCPDGYSWQVPAGDPDALVCRKDGAPPDEPGNGNPEAAALDPQRRVYA